MQANDKDVLQEIPDEELPALRDMYKNNPQMPHVFSLLNTSMKWKKLAPNERYLTYYAPNGDWRSDGTFILHMQWNCYDFFVFTMDSECRRLRKALVSTRRFDWSKPWLFYAVHQMHIDAVLEVLDELKLQPDHCTATDIWAISVEDALKTEVVCPPEAYIKQLSPEDAAVINDLWPHKYDDSEQYIRTFIQMNGGYGLYIKSSNMLAAWVLKNQMGTLGVLQTRNGYKRRGYGTLVTKALALEIAREGHVPLGTILLQNKPSQTMFRKLGYSPIGGVTFVSRNNSQHVVEFPSA